MILWLCIAAMLLLPIFPLPDAYAQGVQLSGGMDARYIAEDGAQKGELEGLFLNLRKVISDEGGDRWILVGQVDAERNIEKIRPYQTYIQYKGPLGKWNIRAGHYILPFGLLTDYDTERLVLRTLEPLSLGIKLDTGVELLGFVREFDYAVSVSQGVGRERLSDADDNKLLSGRIGWHWDDDVNIGLSILNGRVLTEEGSVIRDETGSYALYERRLGIDLTWYYGSLILRGEASAGKDGDKDVGGFLVKADYALSPGLELNLKYAYWQREGERHFAGAGISYELYKGLFLRMADEYQFGKEDENVATLQFYYEFSRQL